MKKLSEDPNEEAISFLVFQAKGGDKDAIIRLYNIFYLPMKRYALLKTKNVMIAEDVVQNVWVKIEKRLRRLNNNYLFKSWLFRALHWEIIDCAKRIHEKRIEHKDIADEQAAARNLEVSSIVSLVTSLPENEMEVTVLHYINGLSVAETALTICLPEGTVKSRLSRARTLMREALSTNSINHEGE
ncbi:RNA polymerase sigma factor [Salinimonas chungwhensis]|uniref:RNA polymerase sigma factor n=1 Tax=Salinimonas chungwhensis TaxID=265425 RepID=UPI000364908C|nr:sigma-70 family RNA polymerase sigma factor [Salinimonas chungwhensis]